MTHDMLQKVSLRYQAVYIPSVDIAPQPNSSLTAHTQNLVANLHKIGYIPSEQLLHALNGVDTEYQQRIYNLLAEALGLELNWAPLVKAWDSPTGERPIYHLITYFANAYGSDEGTTLECGHTIPPHTFPLHRYNGCPFCGTPFVQGKIEDYGQGAKLKVLELFTISDLQKIYNDLLNSVTALDATQVDSLKLLLQCFDIPTDANPPMRETAILVVEALVDKGKGYDAAYLLHSPTDVLRYLWYMQTDSLLIIAPKIYKKKQQNNHAHMFAPLDASQEAATKAAKDLKLKYDRRQCHMVATWINQLPMSTQQMCETMHTKRGMWVRFIRALRLAEFAKREGFEPLRDLLHFFYRGDYNVWQGELDAYREQRDADNTFRLLQQRPGAFARALFANMIRFGGINTLEQFDKVIDKVPARLILTLNMYANMYFDRNYTRSVRTITGIMKDIGTNPLLENLSDEQLYDMIVQVEDMCIRLLGDRFAQQPNDNETIYIDLALYNIPLPIGDRSTTVHDLGATLMGTRLPVVGDKIRLYMQWGKDLPAQPLDMDLSCNIYYADKVQACSYYSLAVDGAKHSGDIRSIPDKVGTAEYIELNLPTLQDAGAQMISFSCNAYLAGGIAPDLVLGWMGSEHPMRISEETGVAYDPSTVQHQVRVVKDISKGLIFGVLDVQAGEIVWLEMEYQGQNQEFADVNALYGFIEKLSGKMSIGHLLALRADAQRLTQLEDPTQADEVYTYDWARNTAAVLTTLVGS